MVEERTRHLGREVVVSEDLTMEEHWVLLRNYKGVKDYHRVVVGSVLFQADTIASYFGTCAKSWIWT